MPGMLGTPPSISSRRRLRVLAGAGVWLLVLAAAGAGAWKGSREPSGLREPLQRLREYFLDTPTAVWIRFPVAAGLPQGMVVYWREGGRLHPIGRVREVNSGGRVLAEVDPKFAREITGRPRFTLVVPSGTAAWIVGTLVTGDRLAAIEEEWRRSLEIQGEAIVRDLTPVLERIARGAATLVEREIPRILGEREAEWNELAEAYRAEIVEGELLPLLKAEIWPTVESMGQPLVERIGEELWSRLPLWGLAWRYAWQKLPGSRGDLVREEWERFLRKDAVPVVSSYSDEIVATLEKIVVAVLANPKVSDGVRRSLEKVVKDPRFHRMVEATARDIVESEKIRGFIDEQLRDPWIRMVTREIGERLQPTIDNAMNHILLDKAGIGINPDFALVLRNQFLLKSRIWIEVDPGDGSEPLPRGGGFSGSVERP